MVDLLALNAALAQALPTGGVVVGGSGTITQSGSVMKVTQTTQKLATDWQSFSIGAGNTVNFVQPSSTAVALNRVLGNDVSVIQGALNANGQVFLVNPNGILFTPTAQVNVGSLVASTLGITTADFMAGNYKFDSAVGGTVAGSAIINQGNITASGGGNIALIAAKVTNTSTGTLTAHAGNVLLGAGSQVTLDMGGSVKLQVTQGAIDTLIENGGAIRAGGGLVYLTAKAAGDLAVSVINNTGVIEARTLATGETGRIMLMGDMKVGSVNVGGTLDASAPDGGNGGFIETSAAQVNVADDVKITAAAPLGKFGTWLLDPDVIEIVAGSSGALPIAALTGTSRIGVATLNTALTTADVDLQANNWIDFQADFAYSGGRDATLGLYAPVIKLGADISSTTNKLNLNFGGTYLTIPYAGSVYLYGSARSIATNGGAVNFNGNIGGAQNLSVNTKPNTGTAAAGAVNFNAAVDGTFNVTGPVTANLALTVKPKNNKIVVINFGAGTVTSDGTLLTGGNVSGTFPSGTVFFPAGTAVSLDAKTEVVTLTLAGGGTQTITAIGGSITIPPGGLSVTAISYVVQNASGYTISAANVTYNATANAGKINDLLVQGGTLTLGAAGSVAVDGNIDLVTSRFINSFGANALTDGDAALTVKNWRVWSTNADPFNISTGDNAGGLVNAFKQYNATYGTTGVLGTGNGLLYTLAPTLTVSLTGTVSKTYNGTVAATLADGNYSVSGVVDSDTVTYSKPLSGTYDTANAGTGKTVTATGVTLGAASKGAATVYGYQLASGTVTGAVGTISKALLTVSTSNVTKTYDGSLTAVGAATVTSGTLYTNASNSNTLDSLSGGTFAFTNANAGTSNKTVSVSGIAVSDGNSGGNYTVTQADNNTSTINKALLTIAGFASNDKTYDGNTSAVIGSQGTLSGVIGSEAVGFTSAGATFDTRDVGASKTVTLNGVTLTGGDAGNYIYTATTTDRSTIFELPAPAQESPPPDNAIRTAQQSVPSGTNAPAAGSFTEVLSTALPSTSASSQPDSAVVSQSGGLTFVQAPDDGGTAPAATGGSGGAGLPVSGGVDPSGFMNIVVVGGGVNSGQSNADPAQ